MKNILCPLTEWWPQTSKKTKKKENIRLVVGANEFNWYTAIQREGNPNLSSESYYGSIKQLLTGVAQRDYIKDKLKCANNIIDSLSNICNISVQIDLTKSLDKIGSDIDQVFDCSFHKEYPPKVFDNIFNRKK